MYFVRISFGDVIYRYRKAVNFGENEKQIMHDTRSFVFAHFFHPKRASDMGELGIIVGAISRGVEIDEYAKSRT